VSASIHGTSDGSRMEMNSKEIFVTCPGCSGYFNISYLFFTPKFESVKLHCPRCGQEFDKKDSLKTW